VGALLLVQVFFGIHYVAAKIVIEIIPPTAWAVLRIAAAAAILMTVAGAAGRLRGLTRRDLGHLAVLSLFGVVINQVCFVEGLHRTTPTHSALINTTIPIGTLLFAVLLGRESLTRAKLLALVASVLGVLLVIHPERASFSDQTLVGDLLTLLNAMSYALFLVLSKRVLVRVDAFAATSVLVSFGAFGISLIGWPQLARFDLAGVPARVWALGAFIVVFATVGAYLLNYWALARVDSSVVALFIYLQPLVASTLAVALLGERPDFHVFAGAVLIFSGVYLSVRDHGASS
jgi:drug/metabolite transporter (DMT)-like permease